MKRRDTLKVLSFSSLGLAASPASAMVPSPEDAKPLVIPNGRQAEEATRDAKLMAEKFFSEQELKTLTILVDIIIPADKKSGSASQAGVPAFIEFIVKDMPQHQTPMRGGLRWLDNQSNKRFDTIFTLCSDKQRLEIIDDIAYPETAKPMFSQGVSFFNLLRNLTATGFFTSKMGIQDLGYVGNVPNQWAGVPKEVLAKYSLNYDASIQYADMV